MFKKEYEIITIKENESFTIKAYDNGDEIIHNAINENELLSLENTYLINGFNKKGA